MTAERIAAATGGMLGTAAATVVTWWAWLGHDDTRTTDPVTHVTSGPYETWQVVGCVLTLVAVGVVAALLLRPWTVAVAMTVAFTLAWSWRATSYDNDGLWPIGALLVFALTAACSTVVAFATAARLRRPTTSVRC